MNKVKKNKKYDENLLKLEEEFINDFIKLRKDKHLTQEELASFYNTLGSLDEIITTI